MKHAVAWEVLKTQIETVARDPKAKFEWVPRSVLFGRVLEIMNDLEDEYE